MKDSTRPVGFLQSHVFFGTIPPSSKKTSMCAQCGRMYAEPLELPASMCHCPECDAKAASDWASKLARDEGRCPFCGRPQAAGCDCGARYPYNPGG